MEAPLPRFQVHEVGLPVDKSLKQTTRGAQPVSGEAEKFAFICAEAEEAKNKNEH